VYKTETELLVKNGRGKCRVLQPKQGEGKSPVGLVQFKSGLLNSGDLLSFADLTAIKQSASSNQSQSFG